MKGEEKYGDVKFIINGLFFSGWVILILIGIFSFLSDVSGYRLDWFLWVQIGGTFSGIFLVALAMLLESLLEKYG
jgi:hypothetical protein